MENLKDRQKRLKITVIDYDLEKTWHAHPLIGELRKRVQKFMPKGLYDPQDLEHQVLFRLTTFDPADITDQTIQEIIEEQFSIIKHRLSKLNYDLEYLFRGLSGKYKDLNVNNRLMMCKEGDRLIAKNETSSFAVEFRQVEDGNLISLFTNELHYVHRNRPKGETFGLFFAGDEIPWAIETTEPSIVVKEYKREALLAHGVDPNKAIELTRFYALPGSPRNAISVMDRLIGKYYSSKGIEALFTTTMPMYSKTKGATIAGGINKVLLVKNLRHKFVPENIEGKKCYRHVTTMPADKSIASKIITTHPNFPTMLIVEVFKLINEPSTTPIDILTDERKVIYVKDEDRDIKIEKEVKFQVDDIVKSLSDIRRISKFSHVEYIRDIIYGEKENNKKIRLRISDTFGGVLLNAIYKYKVDSSEKIKSEIEEIIYNGSNMNEALEAIRRNGEFKEENSYEKVRVVYGAQNVEITLDIYPYGVWIEIEGDPKNIWEIAEKLGYSKKDAITQNADELYMEWNKKAGLKELWHVRFGLSDKFEDK
jgi:adenylate cyclase class IV